MAKTRLISIREWKADDDADVSLYEIPIDVLGDLRSFQDGAELRIKSLRREFATLARSLGLAFDTEVRAERARLIVAWVKAHGALQRPAAEFSAVAF